MKLTFDWLDAPGVKDPAEAATWAELEVTVAGVTVSELLDERHKKVRSRFFGSALPLAEWLLTSWPRLLHERRVPFEGTDAWWDWRGVHSLRAGRRGGAMPNVELVRFSDDEVEVRAMADKADLAPGMSVRFLRDARARVSLASALMELNQFLQAVAAQLVDVQTPRAVAYKAQLAARDLANGTAPLLGRLGLEPQDVAQAQALLKSPRRDELAAVVEASAAPTLAQRLHEAEHVVAHLPDPPPPTPKWKALEQSLHKAPGDTPWLTGWAATRHFREAIGLKATEPIAAKLGVLAERCGWDAQAWIRPAKTLATGVDTIHVREPGSPPCVVTRVQAGPAQTFRVARSLYHGLFGGAGRLVADSKLLRSRFSEANAFAAELVAPLERLKELAPPTGVWEKDDVDKAALAVGASPQVVLHQVQNRPGLGVLAGD